MTHIDHYDESLEDKNFKRNKKGYPAQKEPKIDFKPPDEKAYDGKGLDKFVNDEPGQFQAFIAGTTLYASQLDEARKEIERLKDIIYLVEKMQEPTYDLMRSIIDKMLNIDKPVYSESELLIIKDSIDRHLSK